MSDRTKPFTINKIDRTERVVTLTVRADILGSVANQLKTTPDARKAGKVCCRLGHVIADAATVLYGADQGAFDSLEGVEMVEDRAPALAG